MRDPVTGLPNRWGPRDLMHGIHQLGDRISRDELDGLLERARDALETVRLEAADLPARLRAAADTHRLPSGRLFAHARLMVEAADEIERLKPRE